MDTMTTTILGACPHDCPDTCSLVTTVQDGVAIKVQGNPHHPMTDGVLCAKVSRYTERTYHPDRLLYPMKRTGPKGSGQFERISWQEALTHIAQRLKPIIEQRPEKLLPYSYAGTMGQVQGESMAARFFHRLGASRLDRTICASAGAEALIHTVGGKLGMKMALKDITILKDGSGSTLIKTGGKKKISVGVSLDETVTPADLQDLADVFATGTGKPAPKVADVARTAPERNLGQFARTGVRR